MVYPDRTALTDSEYRALYDLYLDTPIATPVAYISGTPYPFAYLVAISQSGSTRTWSTLTADKSYSLARLYQHGLKVHYDKAGQVMVAIKKPTGYYEMIINSNQWGSAIGSEYVLNVPPLSTLGDENTKTMFFFDELNYYGRGQTFKLTPQQYFQIYDEYGNGIWHDPTPPPTPPTPPMTSISVNYGTTEMTLSSSPVVNVNRSSNTLYLAICPDDISGSFRYICLWGSAFQTVQLPRVCTLWYTSCGNSALLDIDKKLLITDNVKGYNCYLRLSFPVSHQSIVSQSSSETTYLTTVGYEDMVAVDFDQCPSLMDNLFYK